MNDLAKNLLLWVIIAVVLMAVFQSFSPRGAGTQALAYDEFISQVRADSVSKIVIEEDRVTIKGERRDGSKFTTYNPGESYPDPLRLVLVRDPRRDEEANQRMVAESVAGWTRLAPKLVFSTGAGNHVTALKSPHVRSLASWLDADAAGGAAAG